MKLLKTIPLLFFIAINLLVVVAMNFCAYTSCLPPQDHPSTSYYGLMFPLFLILNSLFIPFWLIFKWKITLLPLLGTLLCAGSARAYFPLNLPKEPPQGSLKVLSYNVMAFGKGNIAEWEQNPILNYILESDADILCIQEAQKALVDKAFDRITEVYPYHSLELKAENYIVCFSKYPICSAEMINYPTRSNYSFAYQVLVGTDTLLVINNHLESYRLSQTDKSDYKSIIKNYKHPERNGSEEKYFSLMEKLASHDSIRGYQVDSVAAYVERHVGQHIIVCGDFNASPISYAHHRLTQTLNDAYTRSGNGPGISYHRSGMYFRLDHILVSPNITAYGAKVDRSITESDHYPIFCYVKLE